MAKKKPAAARRPRKKKAAAPAAPPPIQVPPPGPPGPPPGPPGSAAPPTPWVDGRSVVMSNDDNYWFNEGTHHRLYEKLGAHPCEFDGVRGTHFGVWAPDAESVSVVGDFNYWSPGANPLNGSSTGIWTGFVPSIGPGTLYKFHVRSRFNGYVVDKADPYAFAAELPPKTASVVTDLTFAWGDQEWMRERRGTNALEAPMSIYELHLGSWMRVPEEGNRSLSYREIAPKLVEHVQRLGFTHVELMPVMEHPFYGSWGYQVTGYFAPTARYGTPHDFMFLVDTLHRAGIGVILDWVPAHFPNDQHGLGFFDGTHLFEHADPRLGFHPDWKSFIFNYGRNEVRSFLLSSALFWLDRYHADGLRVDGVASMLYRDYSRKAGEWIPNQYGGRENLEAVSFLRHLNEVVYSRHPDVQTIAEESTAWPMVSRPTYIGGLGFGFKWDMGWMHDTLVYMSHEPVHRKYHQNELTFRMIYAFNENFVLPLSHDEVVHGKGALLSKMPGDTWQKFANLRALYAYMYAMPGKKLLFMGAELAQWQEWSHETSLDWDLLRYPSHDGIAKLLSELNRVYRATPALHVRDSEHTGFEWIAADDYESSIMSFLRKGREGDPEVLVVMNLTPVLRGDYRIGVPWPGRWKEMLNTDAAEFGGSGAGNYGGVEAEAVPTHGRLFSLNLTLPPLAVEFFVLES